MPPVASPPAELSLPRGYRADASGLRIWPLRRYWRRWADLQDFAYDPVEFRGRLLFRLRLQFAGRKPSFLWCGEGGIGNLKEVVCLLRWMQAARPGVDGWHDPLVAKLFAAEAAVREWQPRAGTLTDEELLAQARIHLGALQPKQVLQSTGVLRERRSRLWPQAARIEIEARLLLGETEDALDTLAALLADVPAELEARALVANHLLDADDKRGLPLAEAVCAGDLAAFAQVGLRLAWYYVRRKRWDDATALFSRLERCRSRLDKPMQQVLKLAAAELARLRRDPRAADREIAWGVWRARAFAWVPMLLVLGCCLFPLGYVGPSFARESWHLWQLRDHGRRAELVRIFSEREHLSPKKHFLAEIGYELLPDRRNCDPVSLKEPCELHGEELQRWVGLQQAKLDGAMPRGWYAGRATLFDSSAAELRMGRNLQYGTYLPENPAINTIGPITNARIWLTWLGVPQAFLPGLFLCGVLACGAGRTWYRRHRRRWRTGAAG